jgi:hypothetical protein
MTPKEKAKYLISINTLAILSVVGNKLNIFEAKEIAIQCSLIEVDEVLSTLYDYHYDSASGAYEFFTEVKQELENP